MMTSNQKLLAAKLYGIVATVMMTLALIGIAITYEEDQKIKKEAEALINKTQKLYSDHNKLRTLYTISKRKHPDRPRIHMLEQESNFYFKPEVKLSVTQQKFLFPKTDSLY